MTCVMREGEDGVPDTVADIHVEHPEHHHVKLYHHQCDAQLWLRNRFLVIFNDAQTILNSQFPIQHIRSDLRESDHRTLRSWREYQIYSKISFLRQVSHEQKKYKLAFITLSYVSKMASVHLLTCTGRGLWRSWSSGLEAREGCRTDTPLGTCKGKLWRRKNSNKWLTCSIFW